jgi:intein-encoded DNA endonuclease-like protein
MDTIQKVKIINTTISNLRKNLSEGNFDNDKKVRYNIKMKYPLNSEHTERLGRRKEA